MIVQDKSVQNGMFSKAGRLTIEMFTLLQEKDQILTGQRSPQQQGFLPNFYYNRSPQNNIKNPIHRTLRPENGKQQKIPIESQPFTKSVTREQIQKTQSESNISKLGLYTPKYHMIYQKSPLYQDKEFEEFQKQNVVQQRKKAFAENQIKNMKKKRYNLSQNDSIASFQNQMSPGTIKQQSIGNNNNNILDSQNFNESQFINNQSQQLQKYANNISVKNGKNVINNLQQNNSIYQRQQAVQNSKSFFRNQNDESIISNQQLQKSILNRRTVNNSYGSIVSQSGDRKYLGIDFDKPHKKIVGPVSYDKQSQSNFNSLNR
ncbi:hypothetical protein PPERSA_05959 [Pseudocohnilembus persalinus]|uniref:Uncharacterized protein n=1 Tax=Pseudocohnilembus persalinus TaxID=266149 RepID=A0A0V0R4G9_PSEPJ|nr:hypothetical protein PPERSA_05959 [Pseudocohnilembus persalinus]|eukprot:KRX09290.1 hypothetical protein PPERSA_05959 [Pseudocohnilembus persalinus]